MRIPNSRTSSERDDQSMTPMIDVVFLLLIFFVVAAAGQVRDTWVGTDLTGGAVPVEDFVQPEEEEPIPPIWLYLRRSAPDVPTTIQINEGSEPIRDFQILKERLEALAEAGREDIRIILDIDPHVVVDDVVEVFAACRQAKFQSIHFNARMPKGDKAKAAG